MSKNLHGSVNIEWAGGEHTFRLGLREIEQLEADTGQSVFQLFMRMSEISPVASLREYSATIAYGLIGGGVVPVEARGMVKQWVDERPLVESVALAKVILMAALERVHTLNPPGEAEAPSQQDGSTSAPSTETQPSSELPT